MSAREGVVYIISQLLGATLAALMLLVFFPGAKEAHLGGQALAPGIGFGQGVGIEIILTFFLVFPVFATAVDERGAFKMIAGFGIGRSVTKSDHTTLALWCWGDPCDRPRGGAAIAGRIQDSPLQRRFRPVPILCGLIQLAASCLS
jgi:hypothetical protein